MYLRKNFVYYNLNNSDTLMIKNNYFIKIKKFVFLQYFLFQFFNDSLKLIIDFFRNNINFFIGNFFMILKIYKIFLLLTNFLFFRKLSFFDRYMFCISVGLGFRKKIRTYFGTRFLIIYMGTRHWLSFKIPKDVYIFPFKRGSLVFFSKSKYNLNDFLKHLQHVRRELVFKIKGFYLRRIKVNKKIGRTWSFARRVKFRRIKTKLSKKQKFI